MFLYCFRQEAIINLQVNHHKLTKLKSSAESSENGGVSKITIKSVTFSRGLNGAEF